MKFIHLSDLHIGKRVHEFSMIEDQKYILKQILEIIKTEKVDGVFIAGDVYDKPVPSAEAVQVLDNFLTELAKLCVMVFIISGNHDSAERIAFGSELMSARNIFVSPVYDGNVKKICLSDTYGELEVHLLPFLKPAMVRYALTIKENVDENEEITTEEHKISSYEDALQAAILHMDIDVNKRNILLAHQFVLGASCCDSEELQVGGIDQISASLFDNFDYVALGHIHSPQKIGRETVRYCGTPLKYSFSEANQTKSVTILEVKEKGNIDIHTIALRPMRDMRKIKGTYLEVTNRLLSKDTNLEDYVQITLTDEDDIPDVLQKLRIFYPNLMNLEYDNLRTRANQEIIAIDDMGQKSELEILAEFFELQNNQEMTKEQVDFSRDLIEKLLDSCR